MKSKDKETVGLTVGWASWAASTGRAYRRVELGAVGTECIQFWVCRT